MVTREELGLRLLHARRAKKLSQHALGDLIGCPYQVISRIERGYQTVSVERFAALAETLGVSTDALLGLRVAVSRDERVPAA